jgi:hypothetical protein
MTAVGLRDVEAFVRISWLLAGIDGFFRPRWAFRG